MNIKEGLFIFEQPLIPCIKDNLDKLEIYYVYIYLNPLKTGIWFYNDYIFVNEPFYVGKGKNNRMYVHLNEAINTNKKSKKLEIIRKIIKAKQNPIIVKIANNLNEETALFLEGNLQKELYHYNCLTNVVIDSDIFINNPNKEIMSKLISLGNKKSYEKDPLRAKNHSKKISGKKNGRYKKGYLTSGDKNGKYKKIDIFILIELYNLKFNCNQIGKFFNTSCIVPKDRLRKLNFIRKSGCRSSKEEFLKREKLLNKYKKGEITYEQLKQYCKE